MKHICLVRVKRIFSFHLWKSERQIKELFKFSVVRSKLGHIFDKFKVENIIKDKRNGGVENVCLQKL